MVKVQELKAAVAQQQEGFHVKFAQQQKQVEALVATVQIVSDQVALSKPAPPLATKPSITRIETTVTHRARALVRRSVHSRRIFGTRATTGDERDSVLYL